MRGLPRHHSYLTRVAMTGDAAVFPVVEEFYKVLLEAGCAAAGVALCVCCESLESRVVVAVF